MAEKKTVLVTGGSRGIGAAACMAFAQQGADIALIYAGDVQKAEQMEKSLAAYGVQAKAYRCNVSDFHEAAGVFAQILEDFGIVDVLINNAGITRDKLVLMMSAEDFDNVVDVNLKGAFHFIKLVYPVMMRKRTGRIINISSVSGLMGNAGQANYAASKAGIIGLTKSVAKELAARGVTCNAIAPGFIKTDMTQNLEGSDLVKSIPAKRMGTADEVAQLCVFLASDAAGYITGEVIRIDGGLGC